MIDEVRKLSQENERKLKTTEESISTIIEKFAEVLGQNNILEEQNRLLKKQLEDKEQEYNTLFDANQQLSQNNNNNSERLDDLQKQLLQVLMVLEFTFCSNKMQTRTRFV